MRTKKLKNTKRKIISVLLVSCSGIRSCESRRDPRVVGWSVSSSQLLFSETGNISTTSSHKLHCHVVWRCHGIWYVLWRGVHQLEDTTWRDVADVGTGTPSSEIVEVIWKSRTSPLSDWDNLPVHEIIQTIGDHCCQTRTSSYRRLKIGRTRTCCVLSAYVVFFVYSVDMCVKCLEVILFLAHFV